MVKALSKSFLDEMPVRDSDVILSVNGVSKRFCRDLKRSLLYAVQDITADLVGLRQESEILRPKEFWAVKDVSFQLRRGEALGLVGKNGSGKSTLLRVIAGLIKPDAGSVEVKGRIAPLIALGAGFNPILTGRENIYANMSILGLTKQEIDERFDQVVEFAEVGEAIDAPVQTYSSGMAARLGFSSAIHTEPEILLVDEVLAVGDIRFQAKCHRRLEELRQKGTTFILVSHSPQVILGVCDTALYLLNGQRIQQGNVQPVMSRYEQDLFLNNEGEKTQRSIVKPEKLASESLGLDILSVCFKDTQGKIADSLRCGEAATLQIDCKIHRQIDNLIARISFYQIQGGKQCVQFLSNINDQCSIKVLPGHQAITVRLSSVCFKPGIYVMKLVFRENSLSTLDFVESFRFSVTSDVVMSQCEFYQPRSWSVTKNVS